VSGECKCRDQLETVIELDWLNKKVSNTLIETNWLNMLVDRGENKGYVIQADQVWLGNHIPGHLGIFFIDGDIFFQGATARSVPGPPHCRGFTITLRHTALGRTPLDERHLCPWRDSKPQSQQASGKRPTPLDRAAIGIGSVDWDANTNNSRERKRIYPSRGLRTTCLSRERNRIWFWKLP
jgi:hypothetical protein